MIVTSKSDPVTGRVISLKANGESFADERLFDFLWEAIQGDRLVLIVRRAHNNPDRDPSEFDQMWYSCGDDVDHMLSDGEKDAEDC